MYLESYDNLQGYNIFYVSNIHFWECNWRFLKLVLRKHHVRSDVKWSCYTVQALKNHCWCKHKTLEPQRFTLELEILGKKLNPNFLIIHLMMLVG